MLKTNFCEMAVQYLDTHESPDETVKGDFCEAADFYILQQLCNGAYGAFVSATLTEFEWDEVEADLDCRQIQSFFFKYCVNRLVEVNAQPDEFCP